MDRLSLAWIDSASLAWPLPLARLSLAWITKLGIDRLCQALIGSAWHGSAQLGIDRSSSAWIVLAWHRSSQLGIDQVSLASIGSAWHESSQLGMDRLSLAWLLRFYFAWQDLSQLFVNSVQILAKVGGLASHEDPVSASKIKTSSQNIKNVKSWF
jgi:hypothetical protein